MFVLILALASLVPQKLPAGSDVVARYVEAKGGTSLLKKTTSYRLLVEIYIDGKKTTDSEVLQAKGRHLTINTLPMSRCGHRLKVKRFLDRRQLMFGVLSATHSHFSATGV